MDAFISHSSRNHARAQRLESALEAEGLDIWLDDSEIRSGVLLGEELQTSIRRCRALVLLWSRAASRSRWVNSEWLMAPHPDVFVLPCVLDETPCPSACRTASISTCGGSTSTWSGVWHGRSAIPKRATLRWRRVMRSESAELREAIAAIAEGQQAITDRLIGRKLGEAQEIQAVLEDATHNAQLTWPLEPMLINLTGYHIKNASLLKHWDALQAGHAPPDDLLRQAEGRFFETLFVDPHDPSPLNGLGSILMLDRDLDAAEFFVVAAIDAAKRRRLESYPAAESDLETVRRFKGVSALDFR